MKIKYILIYCFVGIAFLAVSAWVFITGGKNARAIRAKYKLGSIMLTCLAMISFASCEGVPPGVTCYDAIVECYDPAPSNYVVLKWPTMNSEGKFILSPGEIIKIRIEGITYKEFDLTVKKLIDDQEGDILQSVRFTPNGDYSYEYSVKYEPTQLDYAGPAQLTVTGYPEGSEAGDIVFIRRELVIAASED